MRKNLLLIIPVLILTNSLFGQLGGNSAFSFLDVNNSARNVALGPSVLSIHDNDISQLYANPGYISDSTHMLAALGYTSYFAGINQATLNYSHTFNKAGSFALTLKYLDYGEFKGTDETGLETGTFRAQDMMLAIGYGRKLSDHFTIGTNLKMASGNYDEGNLFALMSDVALNYFNDDRLFSSSLLIRNAGKVISQGYESGYKNTLPFDIHLAMSKRLQHVPLRLIMDIQHLNHWDLYFRDSTNIQIDPFTGKSNEPSKLEKNADEIMRHFVFGAEFLPFKGLAIRFGYNYQRRREMAVQSRLSTVGFSWGIALKIKKIGIEYSRSAYHLSGSPNVLTLTIPIRNYVK